MQAEGRIWLYHAANIQAAAHARVPCDICAVPGLGQSYYGELRNAFVICAGGPQANDFHIILREGAYREAVRRQLLR